MKCRIDALEVGMVLVADDGFTCLDSGEHCVVYMDEDGFYVKCREGRHYLTGQVDDDGNLVGLVSQTATEGTKS